MRASVHSHTVIVKKNCTVCIYCKWPSPFTCHMIIVLRRLAFVCFRFLKENVHSFSSYSRSSQDFSKLFCFVVCSENFRPNWILVRLHISRPLVCMRGCMIQHCLQACLCTSWNVYSLKYLNKDNSRSFSLFWANVCEWSADTNRTTAHYFMLKSIMAFPILCKRRNYVDFCGKKWN